MFAILTISDSHLLKICLAADGSTLANQLCNGHVSTVNISAVLYDDVTSQKLLKALQFKHVAHGWYDISLVELTQPLTNALVATHQADEVEATDTEAEDNRGEAVVEMNEILEVCGPKQALMPQRSEDMCKAD